MVREDPDPYLVLGVLPTATQAEITHAYRTRLRAFTINTLYQLAALLPIRNARATAVVTRVPSAMAIGTNIHLTVGNLDPSVRLAIGIKTALCGIGRCGQGDSTGDSCSDRNASHQFFHRVPPR